MPKMIVSIDGVVIKEVQLTKDRTTLGRRPYNDVVIDNLAISGEHAVFQMTGSDVFIEDLNSTNGTYVNGKAAKKQQLVNGDTVEVGKYKIKFVGEVASDGFEKTMMVRPGMVPPPNVASAPTAARRWAAPARAPAPRPSPSPSPWRTALPRPAPSTSPPGPPPKPANPGTSTSTSWAAPSTAAACASSPDVCRGPHGTPTSTHTSRWSLTGNGCSPTRSYSGSPGRGHSTPRPPTASPRDGSA